MADEIGVSKIVSTSDAMQRVLARVDLVATTDANVLVTGESGVGKELVAERIHKCSRRADRPLITLNCASIPSGLFESEFFGHVRGAFTGAAKDRIGRFATADGGTLFLDEVAEIPVELQSKLLRAVQSKRFERIGEDRTRSSDVRLIAATNRDLKEEVATGRFRADLFYRLAVFPIDIPPLRSRSEDVPTLALDFLDQCAAAQNRRPPRISDRGLDLLQSHSWPGNVRELRNIIERSLIVTTGDELNIELTPVAAKSTSVEPFNLADAGAARGFLTDHEVRTFEMENLVGVLESCNWKISGREGAAVRLGLNPSTLTSRVKSLSVRQPEPNSLYCQLGRRAGILAMVREITSRVLADEKLSRFWQNSTNLGLLREEQMLVSYLCDRSGGPMPYRGRELTESHGSLGILNDDWQRFECHVDDALDALRLPGAIGAQVTGFLASLREQIVQAS